MKIVYLKYLAVLDMVLTLVISLHFQACFVSTKLDFQQTCLNCHFDQNLTSSPLNILCNYKLVQLELFCHFSAKLRRDKVLLAFHSRVAFQCREKYLNVHQLLHQFHQHFWQFFCQFQNLHGQQQL